MVLDVNKVFSACVITVWCKCLTVPNFDESVILMSKILRNVAFQISKHVNNTFLLVHALVASLLIVPFPLLDIFPYFNCFLTSTDIFPYFNCCNYMVIMFIKRTESLILEISGIANL